MYVLVHSDNEANEDEVKAFTSYDRAYHEMVRQYEETAAANGMTISEGPGVISGCDSNGDGLGDVGFIDNDGAALEAYGNDHRWRIHEVEGAFIPRKVADHFLSMIRTANEMYADKTRDDWFDADDICIEVCDELEGYLN